MARDYELHIDQLTQTEYEREFGPPGDDGQDFYLMVQDMAGFPADPPPTDAELRAMAERDDFNADFPF